MLCQMQNFDYKFNKIYHEIILIYIFSFWILTNKTRWLNIVKWKPIVVLYILKGWQTSPSFLWASQVSTKPILNSLGVTNPFPQPKFLLHDPQYCNPIMLHITLHVIWFMSNFLLLVCLFFSSFFFSLPTLLDGQNEITNSIMVLSPKATTTMSHYIYLFIYLKNWVTT